MRCLCCLILVEQGAVDASIRASGALPQFRFAGDGSGMRFDVHSSACPS
jgi:hypothetical protein